MTSPAAVLAASLGGADAASEERRVEEALRAALAKHLLELRGPADVAHVLLATVTVFVFWAAVRHWEALAWLALFVIAAAARLYNRRHELAATEDAEAIIRLVRRDVWISAILWGGWALLNVGAAPSMLLFIVLIFAGLIAAATSTLVADERTFIGFVLLLLVPLALAIVLSGGSRDHASMILLMVLFAPFMVLVHKSAHATREEQVRARERLRISQAETERRTEFLNALLSSAPLSVIVLDGDGTILRVNHAFEEQFGRTAQDARGGDLVRLVADERGRPGLSAFIQTLAEGRATVADLPLLGADGSTLWMRLSGTKARGSAEGAMIVLAEDVTRQVEAHEAQTAARIQAEETARAKSVFLAGMSHEIRTPMNGILGMVEILLDTPMTDEQRHTAEVIRSSGEGLLRILNDVLDFSKIEASQLDLEVVDFNVHDLLGDVGHVFARGAASQGNELLVDVGEDVPEGVRGDPHRLRQVLSNLVGNAVKFTKDGDIVLSVHRLGFEDGRHRLRFSVRDTGIGIPAEKHDVIFHPFEQADVSTTRTHGGTGLGLSISRRLVELMGGRLGLESEPGWGSDFHFELVVEGARELRSSETRTGVTAELARHRFLVVDDNASARRIVAHALAHVGARATEADSVTSGLAAARAAAARGEAFDAVILDHMMPDRDGFEFAEAIRDDSTYGKPRILMVTSAAPAGGRDRARELDIGGYLAKPVARAELLKALAMLLSRPVHEGEERRMVTKETLTRFTTEARILMAEDNLVNRQVAVALLEKCGHRVTAVADGREAVQAARENEFDLVLMDIQMPEMDGLQATREIRRFADAETLPIVALTAHAFGEEKERARAAGMNDFLSKPFKPAELYEIVERWARIGSSGESSGEEGENMDQAQDRTPPVDLEGFRRLMREAGVADVVDTTVAIYLDDAPKIFERIETAVGAGDAEGIRNAAHSLKSASGNIRAMRLFELLKSMEALGRAGDTTKAGDALGELRSEFTAVISYLRGDAV